MKPRAQMRLAISFFIAVASLASDQELSVPRMKCVSVEQMVINQAVASGVPPHLAFWLTMSESGMNPRAVRKESNGTFSLGLMQANTGSFPNAAWMSPEENVKAGLDYFGQKFRQCRKRSACAVKAYRSGHTD